MNTDEKFLQNYAVNEKVLNSDGATPSERAAAWRQQALILQHLTRNSDETARFSVLAQHHSKIDTRSGEDFLQERCDEVKMLLNGFQQNSVKSEHSDSDWPKVDASLIEAHRPCRGTYMDCRRDEITTEQLQQLKRPQVVERSDRVYTSLVHSQHLQGSDVAPKSLAAPRSNTIANFLLKPTTASGGGNNSTAVGNGTGNNNKNREFASSGTFVEEELSFITARQQDMLDNLKKYGNGINKAAVLSTIAPTGSADYGVSKKRLGIRGTVRSRFKPPVSANQDEENFSSTSRVAEAAPTDERLVNIDPKMIESIRNEIMHSYKPMEWDDIAGLTYAKRSIKEAAVDPLRRPDLFKGLRRPPRGILLFGPPGTGKTLIGKCIASQSNSTFFSISASSLTSKYVGDGEKMVRALFAVAAVHQPAVIFIDEIDSLLTQRCENEHESSRRLKTEFFVQLDGAMTSDDDRILIVAATNRPQELDEAARRRLVKRLYIPLPEQEARIQILTRLLQTVRNCLTASELQKVAQETEGYSGADMASLCREASMEPIRAIPVEEMSTFKEENMRPVSLQDFHSALINVRPSVSQADLKQYVEWNRVYGTGYKQ